MSTELEHVPTMVKSSNIQALRQNLVGDEMDSKTILYLFNEFLLEFEQMEASGEVTTKIFLDAVEEVLDTVLLIPSYELLEPEILQHPLMLFLRQMLIDLLQNWSLSHWRLNIQETDVFLKIILIFIRAAEHAPATSAEEDRGRIKDLLATKQMLFFIRERVDDIVINKNGINDDPNICTLGLLTIQLLQGCPFYYSMERNQHLIDDLVMNCVDSLDYVESIRLLQQGARLSDIDRFLLFTCWRYIPFVGVDDSGPNRGSSTASIINDIYDDLLIRLDHALDEPPPIAPPSLAYIFERCAQLLNIPNLPSFNKHATKVIERLKEMLDSATMKGSTEDDGALIIVALEAFEILSRKSDIRSIMKRYQLVPLLKIFTAPNMGKMRDLALAILAQIMDEDAINENADEITAVFVDQLKKLGQIDDSSTLTSLKALMQHEKIKDELIKQGGLKILIAFIRDGDLQKQTVEQQQDALEIIWSCTFNHPEVVTMLKQDTNFMARVHELLDVAQKTEIVGLEKAAEGIIWKVEKEEKFKEEQAAEVERKKLEKKRQAAETGKDEDDEEEVEEYDLMISYSWADMDLAHKIFNHLTAKLGYKIWLDQEQMHGSTIQAMANAVENAQFILMCMSDTYKRSANCQSEAEYAFNRKKHIVPIKMKKDFVPDGWLGFILGTRMYIDFGTYEFDKAIVLLDNEIQLQKKKRKAAIQKAKEERAAAHGTEGEKPVLASQSPNDTKNVSTWSENDVRDFLIEQRLTPMLHLCDGINGEELIDLYAMCKTSSASMYRALKFELLHGHHKLLPIATYLRFLNRIRKVCVDSPSSGGHISIEKHHDDQLPDDE